MALATLIVVTATFIFGYVAIPLYLNRNKSDEAKPGNTVNGATSSAVVQGGTVGNLTVNNYQPTPTPSPSPNPTPIQSPTPLSRVEPQPTPTIWQQPTAPSAGHLTQSFIRYRDDCAKANYEGALPPGGTYRNTDVGFFVNYDAFSGGVNGGPTAWLTLQMPGEAEPRQVQIRSKHSPSVTTGGCLYTFTVLEVTGEEMKFAFRGKSSRPAGGR